MTERGVLITGATGELGRVFARAFHEHGYFVGVHFHRDEAAAARLLDELGGRGAIVGADLTRLEEAQETFREFFRAHPQIDTLVNNAGGNVDKLFPFLDASAWQRTLDVNLASMYPATHAFLRARIAERSGSVINIASASAFRGLPGQTAYAAAKSGIAGFTRALAREAGSYDIRVNAIAPGAIRSTAIDELPEEKRRLLESAACLGRIGTPDEVTGLAVFLASDAASFITAQVLSVDGGLV